jgi:hypothetical protein
VEYHVGLTGNHVQSGRTELKAAREYQTKARKVGPVPVSCSVPALRLICMLQYLFLAGTWQTTLIFFCAFALSSNFFWCLKAGSFYFRNFSNRQQLQRTNATAMLILVRCSFGDVRIYLRFVCQTNTHKTLCYFT